MLINPTMSERLKRVELKRLSETEEVRERNKFSSRFPRPCSSASLRDRSRVMERVVGGIAIFLSPKGKSLSSKYTRVCPRNGAAHTSATRHIWKRILNKDLFLVSLEPRGSLAVFVLKEVDVHVFRFCATHFAQCLRGSSVNDRRKVTRIITCEFTSTRVLGRVNEKNPPGVSSVRDEHQRLYTAR